MKFGSEKEVRAFVKDHRIEMIDLKIVNLFGGLHHLTLPAARIEDGALRQGEGFDGSSVPGFTLLQKGDMVMLPDLGSGFVDPYAGMPTLSFFTRIVHRDMRPFDRDPRRIAEKAEEVLKRSKVADRSVWGPELEFFVFRSKRTYSTQNGSGFELVFLEDEPLRSAYHACPPFDRLFDMRNIIVQKLEAAGHPVRYHHHEVGFCGQLEIEPKPGGILEMGDGAVLIKYFARNEAHQSGLVATFMPKPICGLPGSGMHFHLWLEKGGKNVFAGKGYGGLSPLAIQFLSGILLHSPALLALTNPSTNSFKRLIAGYEAPTNVFFSVGNRSSAIRIPGYVTDPRQSRFEFRPPDATCNPYLAMAAILLAGIDGVRRKLRPEDHGFGPVDDNIFTWSDERRKTLRPLPSNLREALEALDGDRAFLTGDGVLDDALLDFWIEAKMREEKELSDYPHPWEIDRYFSV